MGQKPILTLLSKSAMADPQKTELWVASRRASGALTIPYDALTGEGMQALMPAIRTLLSEKLERYAAKGMTGRRIRAMVVGIPNVGKSTFINQMSGSKKAKAENRPGVTVNKQWVYSPQGIDLLDMPGVLWPKFDDRKTGENLAITGAIKDSVLNIDEIAMLLCGRLRDSYPKLFMERYKLTEDELNDLDLYDLFLAVGRHRGFLMSGGVVDEDRTAKALLEEFRSAKIGRITLETPKGASF